MIVLWTGKLADIREAQSYYQAERSDAGSLALLQAEKHRLQVSSFVSVLLCQPLAKETHAIYI